MSGKWKITGLLLAGVIMLLPLLSACNAASGQPKEASSLDLRIRDIIANRGIEVLLIPRSSDGFMVETDGSIDAKLWFQNGIGEGAEASDFLIYEWANIPLTSGNYIEFLGASVELVHNQQIDYEDVYGLLDLTLTTVGGKVLTAKLPDLRIAKSYRC